VQISADHFEGRYAGLFDLQDQVVARFTRFTTEPTIDLLVSVGLPEG